MMQRVLEKHSHPTSGALKRESPEHCWELMRCTTPFCPVYLRKHDSCWRLADTCCESTCRSHGLSKIEFCLACPVFKLNAEADPRGWNHFLVAEMGYLTRDGNDTISYPEDMYRDVVDNLPHGLLITDMEDHIYYVNEAAELITGLAAHELIGRKSQQVFFGNDGRVESTCDEGQPGESDVYACEFEMAVDHGGPIFVRLITSSIKDAQGATIAGMHIVEDVTLRKRLEEDLKCSENQYRRLFEGSKDMIFIHSRGSIFMDVNQACVDMLGYASKEELLSVASVERIYLNPMHRRVFQEQIDRFGFVKDFETTFQRQDGTRLHCLVSGNAVRDVDGRIIGYEAIAKDITARMDGFRNLHQQNRELSLLHSIAVAMNITHELDEILMVALKKVLEVLNLNSGAMFLINQEKSDFVMKVRQGLPEKVMEYPGHTVLYDQALMRSLLKGDRTLKPERTFPPFKATLRSADSDESVELLCFLITAKKRASGFIALETGPTRQISDRDHQMLGSLGNFLGSAIDNACLVRTIRHHREELKGLTAKLFYSQEQERKRIAQELHDEAGQALTGINFALETIVKELPPDLTHTEERILDIKKQINRTYQEMRRISHRLHPALLSDLGLEPALEYCLERISRYSPIKIDFRMVGFDERMDPETETILYRISQEAINNALKHSDAKHFRLFIIKSYPNIIFLAEDDGIGFDTGQFEDNRHALGLLGMRERASMVDGKFILRAGEGRGTRIRIEIPIKERSGE